MSDSYTIWGLLTFFLLLNITAPYIASSSSEYSTDGLIEQDFSNFAIGGSSFYLTILTVPFWTFGLPNLMNILLLLPLRVVFVIVLLRNFPVFGSGGA